MEPVPDGSPEDHMADGITAIGAHLGEREQTGSQRGGWT
jgi:hypothetical protein